MLVKVKGGYQIRSHKTGKLYPKVYGSAEAAKERIDQMERFSKSAVAYVIMKAEVSPFTRTRAGHFERVRGWQTQGEIPVLPMSRRAKNFVIKQMDEKLGISPRVTTYPDTDKGFMDFVKNHIGLDRYGALVLDIAKTTPDIRVAINDAYLAVVNEGAKGNVKNKGLDLHQYVLKDKPGLIKFLGKVYEAVKDDILSIRKDLRKSRTPGAKDTKPRKKKGLVKVRNPNPRGEPYIWVKPVKAQVVRLNSEPDKKNRTESSQRWLDSNRDWLD